LEAVSAHRVDIYGGRDPRRIPTYTLPTVAHLAGVSPETLRYWIKHRPLILKPDPESPLLSFINVVEAYMLAHLRRRHGLLLKQIRPAIEYTREDRKNESPLADEDLETDGRELFIRDLDKIINASRRGQIVMPEIIEPYLTRVDWDDLGQPARYYPVVRSAVSAESTAIAMAPRIVMVDPTVSFGRPALMGSGVPTAVIASRFKAGDSIEELARDLDQTVREIEEALRYECPAA
jgi:uncharacterized protein (DUF433 family)